MRAIEDELYPMAELPDEWKIGDDGIAGAELDRRAAPHPHRALIPARPPRRTA